MKFIVSGDHVAVEPKDGSRAELIGQLLAGVKPKVLVELLQTEYAHYEVLVKLLTKEVKS